MESEVRKALLRDLDDWGYALLSPHEKAFPGELLCKLVQEDDVRLLEGFPVVLSSWLAADVRVLPPDLSALEESLPSAGDKKRFRLLVAATWQLMLMLPESEKFRRPLQHYLEAKDPNLLSEVRNAFAHAQQLNAGKVKLSPQRLQTTFTNYVLVRLQGERQRLSDRIENAREIAFSEALGELFSDRQIEIVRKILARQPLTKTDREYYSRVIKKRMAAIANQDLQVLSASLIGRPDAFIKSGLKIDES